MQALAL